MRGEPMTLGSVSCTRTSGRVARTSDFVPVPQAIAEGSIKGPLGDLEVEDDLAAMMSFMSERVT